MNEYEQKQEARRDRYRELADRSRAAGEQRLETARKMASIIPFGQPILVGHYSENRDRNYRSRISKNSDKGFADLKKADYYTQRAASVGTGGISADDPDAVIKLRGELAELEDKQDRMKRANVLVRRGDIAGLVAMGFSDRVAGQLMQKDFAGRQGFPDYETKNNAANIRRIRLRIEALERSADTPERQPIVGDAGAVVGPVKFTITDDAAENRVCITFGAIPPAEIRERLKHSGFKWSPTRSAWVRQRNNAAWSAARYAVGVDVMGVDGQSVDAAAQDAVMGACDTVAQPAFAQGAPHAE